MSDTLISAVDRRRFLTQVMPACSFACLYAGALSGMPASDGEHSAQSDVHKFDAEFERTTTPRQRVTEGNRNLISFIKTLQKELDEEELIRLLKLNSAQIGREVGARQAKNAADTSFQTFVSTFRPPNYQDVLTLEIVEDTAKAFELRVTECVWASVYPGVQDGAGKDPHAGPRPLQPQVPGHDLIAIQNVSLVRRARPVAGTPAGWVPQRHHHVATRNGPCHGPASTLGAAAAPAFHLG
jgi:hypothetical protein